MSLFKKSIPKPAPVVEKSSDLVKYPAILMIRSENQDALLRVLDKADFNELHESGRMSIYLRAMVTPDEEYRNSFQVYAGPKGTKSDKLTPIGRIPAEYEDLVRNDIKKVAAGSHYWSLRVSISLFNEMRLTLDIKESKFNR